MCGSVRIIYAVIYTFFLVCRVVASVNTGNPYYLQGFGLTIGSDVYLFFNKRAQRLVDQMARPTADTQILVGNLTLLDGPSAGEVLKMTFSIATATTRDTKHMIKGKVPLITGR